MIWSNMSPHETFRMYGRVSKSQLEALLETDERLEGIDGIDAHIDEAIAQFPAEDFLEGIKSRLHDLSKKIRGDNKEDLKGIIEALDDLAQCTFNSADYGRSELNSALKALTAAQA